MGAMSRNKGAQFEREIAGRLLGLTGVTFKRNLSQTQSAEQSDLIPDDPDWPFELELKRYAEGDKCLDAWKAQVSKAAQRTGRIPAVIYRFDRRDTRVCVHWRAFGETADKWADIDLEGLCYLAGELMADASLTNSGLGRGVDSPRDRSSRRTQAAQPLRQTEKQTEQSE